jgi:hypothetical protein
MSEKRIKVCFRITQDEAKALARWAEKECRSQTAVIRVFIHSLQKKLARDADRAG